LHLREVGLEKTEVYPEGEREDLTRDRFQGLEEEEVGRYGIGLERPNKRRKMNTRHAVFVTDDEDTTERLTTYDGYSGDSLDEEEGEYGVMDDFDGESSSRAKAERRRSFWLSKGIYPSES
jgi:hypothetical protein